MTIGSIDSSSNLYGNPKINTNPSMSLQELTSEILEAIPFLGFSSEEPTDEADFQNPTGQAQEQLPFVDQ